MDHKAVFLVVDDFDLMCKATVSQLRTMGFHNTLTATNGAEALQIMSQLKVDVVLSDWNMPVMSGLDLFHVMQADPALEDTPFVLITAEAEPRQIREAVAAGVTELIIKPYLPRRLQEQIEKVLSPEYKNRRRAATLARKANQQLATRAQVAISSGPHAGSAQAAGQVFQPAAAKDRSQILIVDDTPENLMLLSYLFRKEYAISLAENGARALELCQGENPPDLVLLDVMMPGLSGFEVDRKSVV